MKSDYFENIKSISKHIKFLISENIPVINMSFIIKTARPIKIRLLITLSLAKDILLAKYIIDDNYDNRKTSFHI